ncbi:MAG: 3-deoxy-8-phosphooctulonate synthase [Desulfovibrio sp.]|nr:3-deoxy-8-phosphooctulonate synthase [Desulfovibrio sp.]
MPNEKAIPLSRPSGSLLCTISNKQPLVLIAGPCAIENREHTLRSASFLQEICARLGIALIYKSSFDKANRSQASSYRGVGMEEGLELLSLVRERFDLPVLTDIHEPGQAERVASCVDYLQIPAFLCRQTDLIQAAAATGKPVNIKKGQFLAPWEMNNVLAKAVSTGNTKISLCERGTTFGYNNLVVDMRSLAVLAQTGHPVVFDATHSVQLPGAMGGKSGGQREFVPVLARAAVAVGVAALFLETHEDPDRAPCDGPNMVPFAELPALLSHIKDLDSMVKERCLLPCES